MKKHIAISLLFLFSLVALKEVTFYSLFKLNQQVIEDVFCINKEKPEMKCQGKCHLNTMLSEAQENNDENVPAFNFQSDYQYIPVSSVSLFSPAVVSFAVCCSPEEILSSYRNSIFHPPQLAA